MQKYNLENLDCANCAARIEQAVKEIPGVRFASVDFATTTLYLDADDLSKVQQTIHRVEPGISIQSKNRHDIQVSTFNTRQKLLPILLAGTLFAAGLIFKNGLLQAWFGFGETILLGAAYVISGWGVLRNAARNITRGKIFDESFLMSVATLGAIAIGEMPEAVGVMLFYMIGEFVQELSVHRSRRSIQALLEVRPDSARIQVGDNYQEVHPEIVNVGDLIMVKPGEKMPLDGNILRGASYVDVSSLTGEPVPIPVKPGDSVLAGSINLEGVLTIEVTRPFEESSIARILELVENASSRKARTEKFITRFARIYSPIVVTIASVIALFPPLFWGASFSDWLYRTFVVLVISCPCALVISIPLGYFGGVGGASRMGILIKGSNFLDILASVKTVVFDKTGTLTQGVFKVTQIIPQNGFSKEELLYFAAEAEAGSNHPIAKSIQQAYGGKLANHIQDFIEISGHGVQTSIDGRVVIVGNDPFLHREGISHDLDFCDGTATTVHVAVDGTHAGYLVISDEIKGDAVRAIENLYASGIEKIIMLTGDTHEASQEIALRLGIQDFQAKLLPEDKVSALEEIMQREGKRGAVAFVGDGINDAPALVRADVGIAMGALGSEAAIESADVVVMADSPTKIVEAIYIGRKTRKIVWQNITLAFIIKGVFIALGIAGQASMWQAVFGDMGVALLAVFNATRVLGLKRSRSKRVFSLGGSGCFQENPKV